jgi:hypothetical protein
VFLAVGKASELHLGDYLPANLREIERWIERDAEAHDWRPFVRYTLECEGLAAPTEEEITQREEVTRAKITRLLEVDVRRADPLGERDARPYGTVISAYCADSATDDRGTWETYMRRIAGLVRPGGTLITAALHRSRGYLVGGKTFPSANVDENDLRAVLEPYFRREDLTIKVCELPEVGSKGYSSIILARAHRRHVAMTTMTPARRGRQELLDTSTKALAADRAVDHARGYEACFVRPDMPAASLSARSPLARDVLWRRRWSTKSSCATPTRCI